MVGWSNLSWFYMFAVKISRVVEALRLHEDRNKTRKNMDVAILPWVYPYSHSILISGRIPAENIVSECSQSISTPTRVPIRRTCSYQRF
ncbi:hypothetical protein HanPSC8_Chr06g0243761 [Helianthus annuus]|nr:hypothetical protein HanPSC8_Chr06g0243761 [Helianthus annuus]